MPTNLFNGMSTSTFLRLCSRHRALRCGTAGKLQMIVPYPLQYLCGGKHAGRGTLFVMVLLQLWYLIHIFDRNGGDAIVFHGYRQRT